MAQRAELINKIWGEKRGRPVTTSLEPTSLRINLVSPNVSTDQVMDGVFTTLQKDPETASRWSEYWGQTRVVVSPLRSLSFDFVDIRSLQEKASAFVGTTQLMTPESIANPGSKGAKYALLLNDKPMTVEGIILQSERMVDELVWVLCQKYVNHGYDRTEAYKQALAEVSQEGYEYYFLNEDEILNLRDADPRYAVRIYGNINKKSKVPNIIGSVAPLEADYDRNRFTQNQIRFTPPAMKTNDDPQRLKEGLVEEEVLAKDAYSLAVFGITIAKPPHIGHLLLASVLETVRRSLGQETKVVLDANDTGPRIIATIAAGANETGMSPDQIIHLINTGKIDSNTVYQWYKGRDKSDLSELAEAEKANANNPLRLTLQGREYGELFGALLGSSVDVRLESDLLDKLDQFYQLGEPAWRNTGFGVKYLAKRILLLEQNGIPSGRTMRAAVVDAAMRQHQTSNVVFVDADPSVTESLDLINEIRKINAVQFNGSAVGFNLDIKSGTKGDSLPISEFLPILKEHLKTDQIIDDLVYFVNTRYQLKGPDHELPFFDYESLNALLADIGRARIERLSQLEKIHHIDQQIVALTDDKIKSPVFLNPIAGNGKLRSIKSALETTSGQRNKALFIKPIKLEETDEIKRAVSKVSRVEGISLKEAAKKVYFDVISGTRTVPSNVIDQLRLHGYANEKLINGINRYVDGDFSLVLQQSSLLHNIRQIEEVPEVTASLDPETSKDIRDSLNACSKILGSAT